MAVAPSAGPKNLETRDHPRPGSGTWPWHGQHRPRTSKHEITHCLRAGHGRGTVSVAQEPRNTRLRTS
ncbi:hypothetical protein BDR03DRAFT_459007 [Suillus americanus]|nr:hypothetical protein BDR03DRAFT_459007 [Suillus americanus]